MAAKQTTVRDYLASLPADRRRLIEAIREVIRANIDEAFREGIQYGAIGYYLPHSRYPDGYHCDPSQPLPFAGLASMKNHVGLHLFCIYGNADEEARFREEWLATGKRLDMGKSCVRVKKLEDVPLEVVGRVFKRMTAKRFVAFYEAALANRGGRGTKKASRKESAARPGARKAPRSKAAKRKPGQRPGA